MVRTATCPICHQPLAKADGSIPDTMPFCCKRCQQADLYRWFAGKYAIVEDLAPDRLAQEMFQSEDQDVNPE
jgi:endogenous inhibitor of DNA gyrase (YacG/DUF329 family)